MYYYREVLEKKLKERENQEENTINIYRSKLGKEKGYNLKDVEQNGDFVYEPAAKDKGAAHVVSEKEVAKMQTAEIDPYTAQQIKSNPVKSKDNKKKKKGIIAATVALILAGVMTISGFLIASKLKKKDANDPTNSTSTSQKNDKIGTRSLDSLGKELEESKEKNSEYTKVSGDFNIEDVVRGSDGLLYVDEESAALATKSGSVEIDTKGGTLVVADNGKVYTKEEGYEVLDENGNVVESGNGTPSTITGGTDYIECPCYFYDDFGNPVHEPGELITLQELEKSREKWHTTKPQGDEYAVIEEEIIYYDEEQTSVEEAPTGSEKVEEPTTYDEETTTSYSDSGVVNSDGTYTIYGVTYASYADYQQYIIDGGAGYGYIDGVIQPIGDYEIENQYTR